MASRNTPQLMILIVLKIPAILQPEWLGITQENRSFNSAKNLCNVDFVLTILDASSLMDLTNWERTMMWTSNTKLNNVEPFFKRVIVTMETDATFCTNKKTSAVFQNLIWWFLSWKTSELTFWTEAKRMAKTPSLLGYWNEKCANRNSN